MKGQALLGIETIKAGETIVTYTDLGEYGITLIRGWREALLKPASVKDYTSNDSRLEHGVRMVATAKFAKMSQREVQISMLLEGSTQSDYLKKYQTLLNAIAYSGLVHLKVPCMGLVFKMVYSDCSKYGDFGMTKGNFTLKLTEPNPSDRETFSIG